MLCESVSKIPPMLQQKAEEVSFASTDSVLNDAPVLIDRCAAYLENHFNRGINDLRSHRLWRVEKGERKDLTEHLQRLLLVFIMHHF